MNQRQKRQWLSLPPFSFVASVLSLVFRQKRQPTSARTRQKIGIPAESAMPFASPLTHSQAYPKMSTANFRQNRQPNRGFRQNRQVPLVPLASRRLVAQSIALLAAAPIADFRQKRQPHLRGSPCAPWLHFVFRQNRQPVSTRAEQKSEIPAESAMTVASPHGEGYPPRRRVLSRGGGTGPG